MSIAFAMCVGMGIYQDERVKKIKVKKHGYKANSFFRYGMDTIREMLYRKPEQWLIFIDKFIRWLNIKLSLYQQAILVG